MGLVIEGKIYLKFLLENSRKEPLNWLRPIMNFDKIFWILRIVFLEVMRRVLIGEFGLIL